MNLKAAVAGMVVGGDDTNVDSARRVLERAESDLAAETRRIAAGQAELEQTTEDLRTMDPDGDAKGFAKAVQARDALRGRLEAHGARRERMVKEFEVARASLAAAEADAARAELARIDVEVRRRGDALVAEAGDWSQRAALEQGELRELAERARRLASELSSTPGAVRIPKWPAEWFANPIELAAQVLRGGR